MAVVKKSIATINGVKRPMLNRDFMGYPFCPQKITGRPWVVATGYGYTFAVNRIMVSAPDAACLYAKIKVQIVVEIEMERKLSNYNPKPDIIVKAGVETLGIEKEIFTV